MITSRVTVGPPDGRSATKDGSETRSCNANLKPANMSVQAGLMRLEEYLGSITGWPMWMRELLSKTHLEYNDRLTIAGVLLGNLVPPNRCGGACTRKAGGWMRTSKHARHIRKDRYR